MFIESSTFDKLIAYQKYFKSNYIEETKSKNRSKATQTYLIEEYLVLIMNVLEMDRVRKTRAFRLDEAILDGLAELAKRKNSSANRLLENMLFEALKSEGVISPELEPLGETRGGDQKSQKAKDSER
ncbi:hypothetical protein SD81_028245 [Tolypothrix campylonemoides VB511288]|nr:hypothetical protein SD81_028245 [Tolypothrix campylonemoides VB511288]